MPQFTILIAVILMLLGLGGYFGTGRVSVTALIPAFFGVALLIAGLLALKEGVRKHAMHVAAAIALLGCVGAAIQGVPKLFGDDPIGTATWMQLAMSGICLIFVAACIRSFINARRSRSAQ